MKRKRPLTLLEVVIALSLLSLLLTTLFSVYATLQRADLSLQEIHNQQLKSRSLEIQLKNALVCSLPVEKEKTYFFTEDLFGHPSLIFSYDRGPQTDPFLSGVVLGRLYLSQNQELVLTTWPDPCRKEACGYCFEEILAEGVESLQFLFYAPPNKQLVVETEEAGAKKHPAPGLSSTWEKSYEFLPPLVQIHLLFTEQKEQKLYLYLPHHQFPLEVAP